MSRQRQHALEDAAAVRGRQRDPTSTCHHVERRSTDARKVGIRARERRHFRVEQDVAEPLLHDATVSERLLEVRHEGPDVQQGLVDVTDDDARHGRKSNKLPRYALAYNPAWSTM